MIFRSPEVNNYSKPRCAEPYELEHHLIYEYGEP